MELVPIKVRIGLKDNGHAKYPDFNKLEAGVRKNLDWSTYIDRFGIGWHYDKTCGHREFREGDDFGDSFGEHCGCLCVPEDFAKAAVSMFPNDVKFLDETEMQDFYDNKAHVHEAEEHVDEQAMKAFEIKHRVMGMAAMEDVAYLAAIDPENPAPGIRRNRSRYWDDFKGKMNITVKSMK